MIDYPPDPDAQDILGILVASPNRDEPGALLAAAEAYASIRSARDRGVIPGPAARGLCGVRWLHVGTWSGCSTHQCLSDRSSPHVCRCIGCGCSCTGPGLVVDSPVSPLLMGGTGMPL